MRWLLLMVLFSSLPAAFVRGQGNSNARPITQYKPVEIRTAPPSTSLRIEGGKIWVNGNLLSPEETPPSLRALAPTLSYQASLVGANEMAFSLNGHDYLAKNGRLLEIPAPTSQPDNNTNREAYYNRLKQEEPAVFYNQNREAALYEQCIRLMLDHQMAQGNQRMAIRDELRTVLNQLFDLSIQNMEVEVIALEKELTFAKKNIQYRKYNKAGIVDRRLKELLGE